MASLTSLVVHVLAIASIELETLAASNIGNLPWSWDTVPLWADFGTTNVSSFSEYQAEFIASHYDIISIEKCLGSSDPTEVSFYKLASKIRQYGSTDDIKILFYFATCACFYTCYNITNHFYQNQSMWVKDDAGNPIYENNRPYYDHTQAYVREWWTDAMMQVVTTAQEQYNVTINGVFADGINGQLNRTHNVSDERAHEYTLGIRSLFTLMRNKFSAYSDDLFLIGNGVATYTGLPNGLQLLPYVDGMLGEHFGAFEEVSTDGTIRVEDLLFWYDTAKLFGEQQGKVLLIKAWVGPETSPINSKGPSWPAAYADTPATAQEKQAAASKLITFPLAVYLCGMYSQYIYFNYAWWYDLSQGYVPCPDDPSACDCPVDWYKEFVNAIGAPKSDGMMSNVTKCTRQFANATVYVDLSDNSSASIQWL